MLPYDLSHAPQELVVLNPLHLRTLSVVLRTGSFAAAGRTLGYTGSAVSQQMRALEVDSGLVLFDRGPHAVTPTASARLLSDRALETLGAMASLQDAVREIAAGTRGRLGLGAFPTASEMLVPGTLAEFGNDHRQVEVRFEDGEPHELLPLLQQGDLDVIVVFRYDVVPEVWPPGCVRTPLLTEPVRLLVPAEIADPTTALALTELANTSWISPRAGSAGARALERSCAAAGFAPQIRYRTNDYDVVRSFVRAGFGVAAVPRLAYLGRVGLRDVDVTGLDIHRHVEALTMADRRNPAIPNILAALQRAAQRVLAQPDVC